MRHAEGFREFGKREFSEVEFEISRRMHERLLRRKRRKRRMFCNNKELAVVIIFSLIHVGTY